jgi:hypothetical protein
MSIQVPVETTVIAAAVPSQEINVSFLGVTLLCFNVASEMMYSTPPQRPSPYSSPLIFT